MQRTRRGGSWQHLIAWTLAAIPLAFLLVFYFYPLANILRVSFGQELGSGGRGIVETVRQPFFWRVLWFTTWQATLSTALTILAGMPLAYVFSHYEFRGKSFLRPR